MASLLSSLLHSAEALKVYDRQLATIQNNVTNASTPGYARQEQEISADRFNLDSGYSGGVVAGSLLSSRSEYADEGVRRQQSQLGDSGQRAGDLSQIESLFDLSASTGVSSTLNGFFQSFSQLAVSPNDGIARQTVIDNASAVATAFNQTAAGITNAVSNADQQIKANVSAINHLAVQLRDLNATRRQDFASSNDAGLDAQVHSTLEELSSYADVSILKQPDGTFTVLLGGQTPLVMGDHQYDIQADFTGNTARLMDSNGYDITSQVSSGQVGALLDERNNVLPSYLTDLNNLARTFADTVNAKLQSGVDASGASPTVDLFSYNSTLGEGSTLAVTDIQPDQIAAAYSTAPGGNGNALDIAAMLDQKLAGDFTFTQAFGNLGARVGRDIADAKQQQSTQQSMVTQARTLRAQVSGVDLSTEAAKLIQVQRAYQANGKLLTVLNDLTDTLINLIR